MTEPRVLGLRDLNRSTLARQFLLERAELSVTEVIESRPAMRVAPSVKLATMRARGALTLEGGGPGPLAIASVFSAFRNREELRRWPHGGTH